MIAILNLLTVLWIGWYALYSVSRIARGRFETVDAVIPIHFLFCAVPLVADLLLGTPQYPDFPGFALAVRDPLTCVLYNLYVSLCPVVWDKFGRAPASARRRAGAAASGFSYIVLRYRRVLYFLLVVPVLLLPFAPDLSVYQYYSIEEREFRERSAEVLGFHAYLSIACLLSIVAASGLLSQSRRFKLAAVITTSFAVVDSWLVGKRYAVAVAIVLIGYAFLARGVVRGFWSWLFAASVVVFFLGFSSYYQSSVRNISTMHRTEEEIYESMRIDFGRDDVIKATLFAELYPAEMQILDYRGQSLLIYATLPIPRRLWADKPISYGTNMACAVRFEPKDYLGWCMTTSILEEAVANFSWFGVILGPLVIAGVCRVGDSTGDGFVGVFTLIVAILFCAVHLSAFMPLLLCWLGLVLRLGSERSRSWASLPPRPRAPALPRRIA